MAQFDVFRGRSSTYALLVDVQADLHARLASRLVIPMVARSRYAQPITRMTPIVTVQDHEYVALTPSMAAMPASMLTTAIASVAQHRALLIAAIDLLVTGS